MNNEIISSAKPFKYKYITPKKLMIESYKKRLEKFKEQLLDFLNTNSESSICDRSIKTELNPEMLYSFVKLISILSETDEDGWYLGLFLFLPSYKNFGAAIGNTFGYWNDSLLVSPNTAREIVVNRLRVSLLDVVNTNKPLGGDVVHVSG